MTSDPEVWTPEGFKTWDQYQQYGNQKSGKKEVVYPASVSSIIPATKEPIFSKYKHFIFGSNFKQSQIDCGERYRKVICSTNHLHHTSFRHIRCNDAGCPVCYVKYAEQISDRVTERWQGYKTVYRGRRPYHLILWGAKIKGANQLYPGLREALAEADRLLKILGARAYSVWFHPYRIRAELKPHLRRWRRANGLDGRAGFWKMAHDDVLGLGSFESYIVYGPHWHAIVDGWLKDVKDFSEENGGAGYKKKRYLETERAIHEVAYYISTHAAREWCKQSVRYYGDISYRMLQREFVEERIKNVLCPVCGSQLEEYDCDEEGITKEKLKDNITEKIKYYLYWKRGTKKPEMKDAFQCLVTRFCRDV